MVLATNIALAGAAGATLTTAPELVLYQDTVAYEVLLDWGAVYVDANSGAVLFNDAVAPVMGGEFYDDDYDDYDDDDYDDDDDDDGEYGEGRLASIFEFVFDND